MDKIPLFSKILCHFIVSTTSKNQCSDIVNISKKVTNYDGKSGIFFVRVVLRMRFIGSVFVETALRGVYSTDHFGGCSLCC